MAKKRPPVGDTSPLQNNPLSSLGELADRVGEGPAPAAEPVATRPRSKAKPAPLGGKIVIRKQRKGHGGKTVTCVEGLRLAQDELEALAKEMRVALGCGGHVDGDMLVLAGEQAPRAEAWLRAHGAKRVVVGS